MQEVVRALNNIPGVRDQSDRGWWTSPRFAHTGTGEVRMLASPSPSDEPITRPAARATASDQPQLLFFCSQASGKSRRTEGFLAQVLQHRRNHETFRVRRIDADRHPHLVE